MELLTALLKGQNSFWPRLVSNVDCKRHPIRDAVRIASGKSSWALFMCVHRKFTPRVAARVKDVLLRIHRKWVRFNKIWAFNPYQGYDGVHVVGCGPRGPRDVSSDDE